MVILTHQTALELWRRDLRWDRLDTRHCRSALQEGASGLELDDVIDALRPSLIPSDADDWPCEEAPAHFLYASGTARTWRLPHSVWHEWPHSLSAGSLYRVISTNRGLKGRPFLVTSPELTLLILGRSMSFPEILELAYELCGTYRLSPSALDGFRSRCDALTTPSSILQLCSRTGRGIHGVKAVRLAASHVQAGSASPRESAVAALLSLNRQYGGMGLPAPEMNGRLDLDFEAQGMCGRNYLRIDLLWREQGVGIEYDSDAFHTHVDPAKVENDKRRINAALRMGVRLFPMTNAQLVDPYRFQSLARTVARALGVRLRPFTAEQLERQADLRNTFLKSR